ncbi:sigma-70 family RNA polymerase sigma factor [Streptomyces sp. NBC_01433]|uniref:sigma-70 family RNA polymerase sigma factor n=1 Tax=Streptomyces sp. NBC_01433 TaxID=2903864 RepID=UPI0022573D68|nr:sigma-70 family RNA polymerase sigma factor [Streptomyces sp. NBC_01433]MCX4679381.1 sigma-70 family RNA polymerase sigma factor [Streptomyces sp. NBC_01433]
MGEDYGTALITAARSGDQRAKDRLVASCLPLLYNIVGRALDGHADVDDVVQESVLRMLRGLPGLRDPESFRSWLVAIAMNEIRGHWRDRTTGALPSDRLDDAHDRADPGADFVDLTILRLGLTGQRRQVAEATRWLDEDDRALLSLWWLETAGQLSRAEVAAALELSPQHTAVRVQRMKAQLEASRVVVSALGSDPRCVLLADIVGEWDGVPSALWRKRLARHARGCTVCSGHGSGLVPAEGLLVGLALVPLAASVTGVAPELVPTAAAHTTVHPTNTPHPTHTSHATAASHADAAIHPSGPGRAERRRGQVRRRRRNSVVAAVVAVAALGTGGGAVHLYATDDDHRDRNEDSVTAVAPADRARSSAPAPTPSHPASSAPSSPTASPSRNPSRSAEPTASKSARPEPSSAAPAPKPAPPAPPSISEQVTELVNTEREKEGCAPVRGNGLMSTAAQGHSADMATRNYFSHTSPDGTDPGDRLTAAGYRWSTYGENIAKGQRTPADVMSSWMDSPGHRANILNCSFKEIGVGMRNTGSGPVWTQNFGAAG